MNFDRLARYYGWLEAIAAGSLMQRARTVWLEELGACSNVLSVGEGHGRFAAAFARRFPATPLTCIDEAARMIDEAQRRVARAGGKVQWIRAEIPGWRTPAASFDGIVTCFFLDCFPPDGLRKVIADLATAATSDATWLIVDFSLPERGAAKWRARVILASLYAFFRRIARVPARTLTSPDSYLVEQGFRLQRRRDFSFGLVRADVWRRSSPSAAACP